MESRSVEAKTTALSCEARVLDQIFYDSPSFMAVTIGADHVFSKHNRAYARNIARDASVVGRKAREILPAYCEERFLQSLDEVFQSGEPHFESEVRFHLTDEKDGERKLLYADFTYQPLFDHAGKVQGTIMHGFDVTSKVLARLSLENERENYRALFRQTPELVVITSGPRHLFEFVNDAYIRVLGFDATGRTLREAQPDSVEVHGIYDEVFRTGSATALHDIPITVTGRLRYFNLTYAARRSPDAVISGVMVLGAEISERKRRRVSSKRLFAFVTSLFRLRRMSLKHRLRPSNCKPTLPPAKSAVAWREPSSATICSGSSREPTDSSTNSPA